MSRSGGAEVINRYAPGRMRELISNLEVFLQVCRSIGSQPMTSEFVMSFGQEGLSALMGELDFPWQLVGVLHAVYKPTDIGLLLDLCKDRFLSIVRDFNELKNLLSLLTPGRQLQLLTCYWDKVRLLLPADFTQKDIGELKWAMRNPNLGPTLEALMFETLPELKRLVLTDASAVDTMNVYQKFLAQIKNPQTLGVFLASLQPDQQIDLIVSSWAKIADIVQQIAKPEDLLDVFRGLGSDAQSLLLQRIFQPEKPLLLPASLRAAAASSDTALVLRSGSAASHGVAGALNVVRATASAGAVASTAAPAPLTNRASLLSFLPDALASSLHSIQEFSRLMGTLRPELKLEILAQFLPEPTKDDKHSYRIYRDKNLTDQDIGIINALKKEGYGCYRLYGSVEPPILQCTLYGLALAYRNILERSAHGVMGYMSGGRGKLASLDLVIHAMETGIKLTGNEQKCLGSHAVADDLYGKCSEMLTAPSLSPSETSVSSYTPRR